MRGGRLPCVVEALYVVGEYARGGRRPPAAARPPCASNSIKSYSATAERPFAQSGWNTTITVQIAKSSAPRVVKRMVEGGMRCAILSAHGAHMYRESKE